VSEPRLVAVLGYSDGDGDTLHPICAARMARATKEAGAADVVLFSGRAHGRARVSEAELMARAWHSSARRLVLDNDASSTFGNVLGASAAARRVAAREVVLVTSSWHGRRASRLLRAALRDVAIPVTLAASDDRGSIAARLRELACWALVPLQLLAVRRKS
jgi:uncharacterized SAM-binding protein YcdF (DUF218 family)